MVNSVDNSTLKALGLGISDNKSNTRLGQDDFLKLMITQFRNQDPFKPLESGEFLGQIAQFSTVSGIQELQTSFTNLADSLYSNQALQASSLIGRRVFVSSDTAQFISKDEIMGMIKLDSGTADLNVNIFDSAGQLIKTARLGRQSPGLIQFSWDGMTETGVAAQPGLYRLQAVDSGTDTGRALEILPAGKVNSVTMGPGGQGITLNLGRMGEVDFSDVKQIM